MSTRRTFLTRTLAAGSALLWLPGCADDHEGDVEDAHGPSNSLLRRQEERAAELASRKKLALERVAQANDHDLTALVSAYTRDAELVVNGVQLTGGAIRPVLEELGFGTQPGGLANARVTTDAEFLTEEEILHRGRLTGKHVGTLLGFPPLGKDVTIYFAAFRRFTRDERLVSERLTLNLGVLLPNWTLINA